MIEETTIYRSFSPDLNRSQPPSLRPNNIPFIMREMPWFCLEVVGLFVNQPLFASFPNLFTGYFHLGRASLDTRHASEPQNPLHPHHNPHHHPHHHHPHHPCLNPVPHKCNQCNLGSSPADILSSHVKTHSGEKISEMQPGGIFLCCSL